MLGASQTYNQGMQNFAQSYTAMKAKQEADQELLAKARSTENFIKTHADQFGGEESVKMLTATSPNETPKAKYARLGQAVQDMVVGSKVKNDQAQAQEAQARAQFQQAQLAQMQGQQQRQDAMRQQLKAALAARQQNGGNGPMPWNPDGSPMEQPPRSLQDRNLDIFAMTGEPATQNELTTMMAGDDRNALGDERNARIREVAAEREKTKAVELLAKNAPPVWHDIPGMDGSKVANINGQAVVAHPPVPKNAQDARIEALMGLPPEQGGITKAEGAELTKKIIATEIAGKMDPMIQMIGMNNPKLAEQMMASRQKQIDSIWASGTKQTTNPADLPTITTQAAYDKLAPGAQYIDRTGQIATKRKR